MASTAEIEAFKSFMDAQTKEHGLKLLCAASDDGEGYVFSSKGRKSFIVSLETNIAGDKFWREVAGFFGINSDSSKSWQARFANWNSVKPTPPAPITQPAATQITEPQLVPAPPLDALTCTAAILNPDLLTAAEAIRTIYKTLPVNDLNAFLHVYVSGGSGLPSRSDPNAHLRVMQVFIDTASSAKLFLTECQVTNAVAVYLNSSKMQRRNPQLMIRKMAAAMASPVAIGCDQEMLNMRRRKRAAWKYRLSIRQKTTPSSPSRHSADRAGGIHPAPGSNGPR